MFGVLAWFFFGPKQARLAAVRGGMQEVVVTVRGGYSPDLIRVRLGMPLRLVFDRRESGECTSRVVFPDFGVSRSLPAFGKAVVELIPDRVGEFGFACGMNMVHGRLLVEPAAGTGVGHGISPSLMEAPAHTHEGARAVGVGSTMAVAVPAATNAPAVPVALSTDQPPSGAAPPRMSGADLWQAIVSLRQGSDKGDPIARLNELKFLDHHSGRRLELLDAHIAAQERFLVGLRGLRERVRLEVAEVQA